MHYDLITNILRHVFMNHAVSLDNNESPHVDDYQACHAFRSNTLYFLEVMGLWRSEKRTNNIFIP